MDQSSINDTFNDGNSIEERQPFHDKGWNSETSESSAARRLREQKSRITQLTRGKIYSLAGSSFSKSPLPLNQPVAREVTVVIPVLNESKRIAQVVKFAVKSRAVKQVLVIDDGSIDGTPELAHAAGARVITSSILGKGGSMEDGLTHAATETILYLDGDLNGLRRDLIPTMCGPIWDGAAHFVKAKFSRKAGRVTVLTARPLLRTYFREVAHFDQPLGGIIAARVDLLKRLRFENDYGVDIGLLLDAVGLGARIAEVDIGHIEHESQDLDRLGEMATQVARAILDRAAIYGRMKQSFIREVRAKETLSQSNPELVVSRIGAVDKLALFDMDGTLLQERFIVELARRTGRVERLAKFLDRRDITPELRARSIARIFSGVRLEVFTETAMQMVLAPGAVETVVGLRKRGYRVGIITDSYQVAAEIVRKRVFADFSLSNVVEFRKGCATGIVTLAPTMRGNQTGRRAYDKLNALRFLTRRMRISPKQVLAVGDGENDIGMLRASGISVAFQPKSEQVRRAAQHVVIDRLDRIFQLIPDAEFGI